MAAKHKESARYFSHDSNARNSDKLIRLRMRHGAAGYGVFFMILERLREEDDYMSVKDYNMIAFDLRVDASLIKSVVEDFGLFAFTENGKCFYSESFSQRMAVKDEKTKARSQAGKAAMEKRYSNTITKLPENGSNAKKNDSNAITKPPESGNNKNKIKENKIIPPIIPPKGDFREIEAKFIDAFFSESNYGALEQFCMSAKIEDSPPFANLRSVITEVSNYIILSGQFEPYESSWRRSVMNLARAEIQKQKQYGRTNNPGRPAGGLAAKLPVTPDCGVKRRPNPQG